MLSVVSVFPLLHPCAIRFPGSKTQKSSLTCFQWPIFSPCWTHVYAFTVPSFSLVAPCCTHVSFRFSVSKTEKSYLTCVQWRIFCLPFVPLVCHWNFRGQNPYLNQKQENTECFQTCFFNHFCLNHFPVNKNDRSETVLHILAISHFSAVPPRCVLLLCCSPPVSLSTDGIDPARSPAAPRWSTQKSPQRRRRAKSLCYTPWSLRLKTIGMKSMRRDPFMVCTHYSPNTCVMWTYSKSALSPISCVQSLAYIIENHGRRCPSND